MRLASKFYRRLTIVFRLVEETHKATFGSSPFVQRTLQGCIRIVNRDTTGWRRDVTPTKDMRRNSCYVLSHARMHARMYYAAVITLPHVLPILIFFSLLFFSLRGINGFYVAGSLNRRRRT